MRRITADRNTYLLLSGICSLVYFLYMVYSCYLTTVFSQTAGWYDINTVKASSSSAALVLNAHLIVVFLGLAACIVSYVIRNKFCAIGSSVLFIIAALMLMQITLTFLLPSIVLCIIGAVSTHNFNKKNDGKTSAPSAA